MVRVRNQAGSFGEAPEVVEIAPGQYWVEARATNVGRVRLPVEIQAGQTAILYLDKTTAPAAQSVQETQWVRQPSGATRDIENIDLRK